MLLRDARGEGWKKAKSRGGDGSGVIAPIDWDAFYALARAYDIQPSEFWAMTIPETLLEFEMREKKDPALCGLTQEQDEELRDWMARDYGRA